MPNGYVHKPIGALIGTAVYLKTKKESGLEPSFPGMLASCVGGYAVASLPDILEPVFSPNHRSFFHSLVAAGILVYVGYNIWKWMQSDQEAGSEIGAICLSLVASYQSHLALDAFTPRGLPLV